MRLTLSSWRRRLGLLLTCVTLILLSTAATASAHPLSTSAVLLDVDRDVVHATVELPLDQLSVARGQSLTAATVLDARTVEGLRTYVQAHLSASDATGRSWSTAVTGGRVAKVDGVDNLVLDATLVPASGAVGDFVLHDDAVMDQLVSHRVFVSGRYGHTGPYTTLAMLSWQTQSVPVASTMPSGTTSLSDGGFVSAVRLGMHHIASGSDHLLFLIMLLLPAPLIAVGGRWRTRSDGGSAGIKRSSVRVVHVVTAFAIGHSCTLVLGALGWVELPSRLVEGGIAFSVLISAVHALRPLVRRGEVLIAGGFGLLHGLAFATLLGGLDLSRESLVTTLLGFNLGIELTQLIVVALVMPSLLLLSRTPTYPVFRAVVASLGAVLAAGWLGERIGLTPVNPVEPIANLLVDHPAGLAAALAVVALTLAGLQSTRSTLPARLAPSTSNPSLVVADPAELAEPDARGPNCIPHPTGLRT